MNGLRLTIVHASLGVLAIRNLDCFFKSVLSLLVILLSIDVTDRRGAGRPGKTS